MGKTIKIKSEQLKMLKEYEDKLHKKIVLTTKQIKMLSEKFDVADKIQKNFDDSFRKQSLKTEEDLLGHPVQGDGSNYKAQSEKENEKTFKSFNEGEAKVKPSLKDFSINLMEFIRNQIKGNKDYPDFFKENEVSKYKLNKALRREKIIKDCLVGEDMNIKVNKDFGPSIKRVYEMFFPGDFELNEDYPMGAGQDPRAPFNTKEKRSTTPRKVNQIRFKEIYTEGRTSIFTDGKYYYYFDYQGKDDSEFMDYVSREYSLLGKDDDGDYDVDFGDYDINVDGDVVELYVNDNLNHLNNGKGVSKEIIGLKYMESGDYDFVIMDDECKRVYLASFVRDAKGKAFLTKTFNIELEETTTAGASSGQYNAPMMGGGMQKEFPHTPEQELSEETPFGDDNIIYIGTAGNYEMVSGDIGDNGSHIVKLQNTDPSKPNIADSLVFKKEGNVVKIGVKFSSKGLADISDYLDGEDLGKVVNYAKNIFKNDGLEETTTTGASSGQYSTPKIWAKSKKDHIPSKKPAYPNGKIVENNQTDTAYPEGEFVELDKCTKIGHNDKTAINGGCSQGAVDGVVKTKKTSKSTISKEALYYEVAKKTGKKIEEVRKIIEKNRIK